MTKRPPDPQRASSRTRGSRSRRSAQTEPSDSRCATGARPKRPIRAAAGIAVLGSHVIVHGRDLHRDCANLSFVHYVMLCATGRAFDPRWARVFERLWIGTGYPDARIWCNRIAGYMGSARVDPGLAVSAALAATNSVAYRFVAMRLAYRVQAALPESLASRRAWLADQLRGRRILSGYGRPAAGPDERIAAALQTLADESLRAGPALKRAFWLHDELHRAKGIQMNISALWAAVALDIGITEPEYDAFMLLMFTPGYIAVYADQRARRALQFLAGHQTTDSSRKHEP